MKSQEKSQVFVMEREDRNMEKSYKEVIGAAEDGRIIQGVFDCARVLEMDPDKVQICILREGDSSDISVKIQHTLIEAYCWENDISVLKVGPDDKLRNIPVSDKDIRKKYMDDDSCILVMSPVKDIEKLTDQDPWVNTDILLPG